MNLVEAWKCIYRTPRETFTVIADKKAIFSVKAYLLRGIATSILFFLPLVFLGRSPEPPSFIIFWPTDEYYKIMVFIYPIVSIAILFINGSLVHVILQMLSKSNDIDKILNVSGIANLATFPLLLSFDWISLLIFGGLDPIIIGIIHILIDGFYLYIMIIGYHENLGLNWKLTFLLFIVQMIVSVPIAALLFRG
ncbi:MAG: hypothetical protein GF411_19265 [Candidatus Lokiarchaeota archaeon]|nr:hypothetical protein [Candidatus Lokiarchaeota archaeon]